MSKLITREALLESCKLKTRDFEVKELGGFLRIRQFTAAQGKELMDSLDNVNYRCLILTMSLVHENGTLMFSIGDIGILEQFSNKVIEIIAREIVDFNKLSEDAVDKTEKN